MILVDLTVMSLGILADIHFGVFVLQTIWSIGISMAILGLMIWLPFNAIFITGLLIVFGHNALDYVEKIMQDNSLCGGLCFMYVVCIHFGEATSYL
ncbi:MAG: hypothetical protein H7320_15885 [Ferruginibacter sp.]|nr:hypothetical protein [Ferruginibacter sp.]